MLKISDLGSRGILYYPCSENKGADQIRGYRDADLRLCFRICKIRVSHDEANIGLTAVRTDIPVSRPRSVKHALVSVKGTEKCRTE